ncbi:MAG: hypothetical protein ABI311_01375 [Gemmatimonadaceae bacterium]
MKSIALTRCVLISTLAVLSACGSGTVSDSNSGTPTGPAPKPALVRIVNSVFQYTDTTKSQWYTAPRSIDFLIDSSATAPSVRAIAPEFLAEPSVADAALYEEVSAGMHSFVARLAGSSGPLSSLYTGASGAQYLPTQNLVSGTHYTIVVAGIIPVTAAPGATQAVTPQTAVPFAIVTDDRSAPPVVNGKYQARIRVINAAPFDVESGAGAPLSIYITSGALPPPMLAGLTPVAVAPYRGGSAVVNIDAGRYYLTLAAGDTPTIVAQAGLTFAAGEVRTFILQSSGHAANPSPGNHDLRTLLDAQY